MEILPERAILDTPEGSFAGSDVFSDADEIDPRQRFKIIDYGLGVFDENYAAGPDLIISEVILCHGGSPLPL